MNVCHRERRGNKRKKREKSEKKGKNVKKKRKKAKKSRKKKGKRRGLIEWYFHILPSVQQREAEGRVA